MQMFPLVALTPPGLADPAIAIAASRAGGLGVLDLAFTHEAPRAHDAIAKLARYAGRQSGIRLDSLAHELIDQLLADLPEAVQVVILTSADPESLSGYIRTLHEQRRSVWLEVASLEQARRAEQCGADGLVAKGHEAGGWVGDETTFILLQRLLSQTCVPVWAQGGIGLHSAAACFAAGAAGVLLDSQLALTRESRLPEAAKTAIAAMDGSETLCLGAELGQPFRVYARPGLAAVDRLRRTAIALAQEARSGHELARDWRQAVEAYAGWGSAEQQVWPLGQDAAFAAPLAQRYQTVGGVLGAMRESIHAHLESARALRPLDVAAPMAQSHGTRYPIVQGPMTRVSDRAAFALRVAEGGALPFLALALMRAPEVSALLEETQRLLGERPWGVGILGFVPFELRREQLEVIRSFRPPFALIAGGRPDQARALEQDGIPTYLHVPSPGLLRLFLQDGARRFVFEGRECGGHVGPRSSFVLWNTMVDVLLAELPAGEAASCHVLFAGGVHDALSAAMVAALAAPLAERGVRVGVLLGTAYLFTEEAVATGAILPGFQEEARRCERTVLVESGPGHAIRCVATPFTAEFEREKRRLIAAGKSADEVRLALEELNVGRLRIASKGITRGPRYDQNPDETGFIALDEQDQRRQGMYMIGQLAALREQVCTIAQLHHEVSVEGARRLQQLPGAALAEALPAAQPSAIAIVGMSCMLPKAGDLQTYWENILNKTNAITEIPKDRWNWELYFDPDPGARDKIYSKWGGFIDDVLFDPLEYGMPPNSLASIDPMQLLALVAARAALKDAGYHERPFDRSRTSVVLGASGGIGNLGGTYLLRSGLPMLFGDAATEIVAGADGMLPEWTEDSFAGLLLNVVAGRIANRLDLGGLNYVVDAACASSLTAIHLAVKELETHGTDMVITGGVDTTQTAFGYLCFSKTRALSPLGESRTFDASADGIAISEGIVMMVLKRLADAERDGDRVYAVIRGVGASSDGKAKGLTAPRAEGQVLALQRAYAKAGISPTTVGLFEAHGTGTVVGDRTEALALSTFLDRAGAAPQSAAIGSVKSMIGHTKASAGVAGIAKVALALYHKILPPTLGVTQPNPKARFGEGPLYVNSETRPWVHGDPDQPRRAGVSAFGFGGTNFHVVVEEYSGDFLPRPAASRRWPSELLVWSADTRHELAATLAALEQSLAQRARPELCDLAYTLAEALRRHGAARDVRLAIVANDLEDLQRKLALARQALAASGPLESQEPRGIYFSQVPVAQAGKVAFLFPGQGSQYPNMLRDLAVQFAEVRGAFECADRALHERFAQPLSYAIFPPPAFGQEEERRQQQALTQTNVAQPALGAAATGLLDLLAALGVRPDITAGHSYGEYVALCAAGVFDEQVLATLSEARGRCIVEAAREDLGTMAAAQAGPEPVAAALEGIAGVWLANLNAPQQTIISGTRDGIARAVERLNAQGIHTSSIPVACAFHSPLSAPAQARLEQVLAAVTFAEPRLPVFSNTTAAPYPRGPREIAALLAQHLVRPVRFAEQVEAMYAAGARIFVEVGPRNVLTGLTRQVLGSREHLAVAMDLSGRHGLTQLQHALGQLMVHGVPVQLDRLFQERAARRLNLSALAAETSAPAPSPTTWVVSGGRARPLHEPAPAAGPDQRADHMPPIALPPVTQNGNGHATGMLPAARLVAEPRPPDQASAAPARPAAPAQPVVPPAPAPLASAPPLNGGPEAGDEVAAVMLQYQQLMGRFLETQRNVMLTYLQGVPAMGAGLDAAPVSLPVPTPVQAAEHSDPPAAAPVPQELAPDAAAPEAVLPTREQLTRQLLQIVAERTGYPVEMLDLDVDIEADLGIDSIKRVEILGALQHGSIPADRQIDQEVMEQLAAIKTLRGIVDWLDRALRSAVESGAPERVSEPQEHIPADARRPIAPALNGGPARLQRPAAAQDENSGSSRYTLVAVDAPAIGDRPLRFAPDRVVLLTDDGRGVGEALSVQIRERGGRAVLVRPGSRAGAVAPALYEGDLADPAAVAELVALVARREGPIGGIVHLLPLRGGQDLSAMDLAAWRERLRWEVKSLFYLASAAAEDLKRAGAAGAAWVVAATGMGGTCALDAARGQSFFPGQAGIAGLVKTMALEWPDLRCKAVDLDLENPLATLAEQLLCELAADDRLVEVGYQGSRRRVLRPVPAPLDQSEPPHIAIGPDWVVLVTGGARGITAEVACALAERYRPTLLLVGSSPWPQAEESPATAGLSAPQELKAALIEQMRRRGQPFTLPQIEAAYNRLLRDREMRASLARMQRAGATVRYEQADVRDEHALAKLVENVYRDYGRLDGVVHGAGIIEDKLLVDKAPDSFDRVFDTKADSAFILSRVLRAEALKFLVLFSSTAGTFGNRGQCDYAAANEVLNKLAIDLDQRWPGRVVAINWGPWAKTGMVSQELQRQFALRGVQLIALTAGCRALDHEIGYGRKGQAQVIVGGWEPPAASEQANGATETPLPLLRRAAIARKDGAIEALLPLEPAHDRYLRDHQLDGKPVLPAAMAIELMAELALLGWPGLEVVELRELRVLHGVVLEQGTKTVRVSARALPAQEPTGVRVHVEIGDPERRDLCYYRATVELADAFPDPPPHALPLADRLQPFPLTVDESYRQWLFHGPIFQGIGEIQGASDDGIVATCLPSTPRRCLAGDPEGEWLIDPVVFDSGLQLSILWARAYLDMTTLIAGFQRYRRFRPASEASVRCHLQVLDRPQHHMLSMNMFFVDSEGRLIGLAEHVDFPFSKALNRLAETNVSG